MNTVRQTLILFKRLGMRSIFKRVYILLGLCIFVNALISASLDYFSLGVKNALDNDIERFLGGSLVIRTNQAIDKNSWQKLDITPIETVSITTGAIGKNGYQSIGLKSVSLGYPLQGQVKVRNEKGNTIETDDIPKPGNAWLDSRALAYLGVAIGAEIQVGKSYFKVTKELAYEPDRLTQLQYLVPRVLINRESLVSTGVLAQSSRAEFRYLLNISEKKIQDIRNKLPYLINTSYQLLTANAGQHPFSRISLRVERFLDMVKILILLLCGSAVAALTEYSIRHYIMPSTVLRCMGTEKDAVSIAILIQLLIIAFIFGTIGCFIAWFIQPLVHIMTAPHLMLSTMSFSTSSLLHVNVVSTIIIFAFAAPKMHILSKLTTVSILRGQYMKIRRSFFYTLFSISSISALLWHSSDNIKLTVFLTIGVIFVISFSIIFGWSLSKLSGQIYRLLSGPAKVSLRSISRQPKKHMISLVTVSVAIMAIVMTTTLRGSFLETYHIQRLHTDGNYIFNRLPTSQENKFKEVLISHNVELKRIFPILNAKLVKINGINLDDVLSTESDTREEARSTVRLSWSEKPPENNRMLDGEWPTVGSKEVSVEAEVMSDLGLKLGDELSFQIDDSLFTAKITSRREFKGGGSSFMFWFMFAPDTLQKFSKKHVLIGGIHIDENRSEVLSDLLKQHPQILVIELEKQLRRIKVIMLALTNAINGVLCLLLTAAFTVVISTAYIGMESRMYQVNLLRTLGFNRRGCFSFILIEQLSVAMVACIVGLMCAFIVSSLMFQSVFALQYKPDLTLSLSILVIVLFGFTLMGIIFAHRSTRKTTWISRPL